MPNLDIPDTQLTAAWAANHCGVTRLAPNGTNRGLFSDQILVHNCSMSQNLLKSDLKKVPNLPIWGQSEQFGPESDMTELVSDK